MLHREHGAMFARFGTVSDFTAGTLERRRENLADALPPLQLQPRIFSHQISSIGAVARSPRFGRSPQYLATDCGGPPSLDGPRQPSRITATSTRPCQASPRQHRPVAMSVSGGRPEVVDCRSNRRD
jgi:hypothetical protein